MSPILHAPGWKLYKNDAVRMFRSHKDGGELKKFEVPEDLLVIGCHNHDTSFFEEQMEAYGCKDYICLHLDLTPWSNTLRLIPYIDFLRKSSKEYVLFLDTDDVFVSESPDKILDIFLKEFDCEILFNATRFAQGYWHTESSRKALEWANETHKDLYLNAGAYIGKRKFIIELYERVLQFVTHDDLASHEWYNITNEEQKEIGHDFPTGCGSDQAILRHIEHEFYPKLLIDEKQKIFCRGL